ncbi:helix-turn-helix domain-containing protein [Bacillus pinisoli]|uniref:helix-turn-helix domain-containing protein n=1 Tax=Bacillus pinisoli TaxID=2901866 RepID=UPI001FF26A1C|nr:helix-turn-helix domain-containing protein [Bacillus pinisoli]
MGIGKNIKYIRTQKRVTQKALAEGICSISYLSKIENELAEPSPEVLNQFCDRLGISNEEIDKQNDTLALLKSEFDVLHSIIRERDKEKAELKFNEIMTNFPNLIEPEAYLIKALFELRLAIMNRDKLQADTFFIEVASHINYQSDWTMQYYYRYCGLYQYLYGSYEDAIEYYLLAERYLEEDKEEVYYHLALAYYELDQISISTFYINRALDLFMKKNQVELVTNCKLLLGINYTKLNEFQKAKAYFNEILENSNRNNTFLRGKVYHSLGVLYSKEGDSAKAIQYYFESLVTKENSSSKTITMYFLAKEYYKQDELELAYDWLEKGFENAVENQDQDYRVKFTVLKFFILREENGVDFEDYLVNVAIPHFEAKNETHTVKEYIELLASYYERNRQYKSANELLRKLIT